MTENFKYRISLTRYFNNTSFVKIQKPIPVSALYISPQPRNYCFIPFEKTESFLALKARRQIIFTSLNSDYSAYDRGRDPKLVWIELLGHGDSKICP
jgi:hypothetical protein